MISRLAQRRAGPLTRAMATHARGLPALLEKKPDDVVLTYAKRTAMARARKGQLKDIPVDELMQALIKVSTSLCGDTGSLIHGPLCQATLEKTKLDPAELEDICVGTAMYYMPSMSG